MANPVGPSWVPQHNMYKYDTLMAPRGQPRHISTAPRVFLLPAMSSRAQSLSLAECLSLKLGSQVPPPGSAQGLEACFPSEDLATPDATTSHTRYTLVQNVIIFTR